MLVREATPEDAKAIAAIHVRAWQAAYQGIVPSTVLNSLSVDERETIWFRNLERRASKTLVAEESGQVLGWISAAQSRDENAPKSTGEVWGIYVAPACSRRGVGRRLWREAEEYLDASGYSDVTLWVLKENAQAIAFYESMGLAIEPGVEKTITMGGTDLIEIRLRKRVGD